MHYTKKYYSKEIVVNFISDKIEIRHIKAYVDRRNDIRINLGCEYYFLPMDDNNGKLKEALKKLPSNSKVTFLGHCFPGVDMISNENGKFIFYDRLANLLKNNIPKKSKNIKINLLGCYTGTDCKFFQKKSFAKKLYENLDDRFVVQARTTQIESFDGAKGCIISSKKKFSDLNYELTALRLKKNEIKSSRKHPILTSTSANLSAELNYLSLTFKMFFKKIQYACCKWRPFIPREKRLEKNSKVTFFKDKNGKIAREDAYKDRKKNPVCDARMSANRLRYF
jgi:hypothetical protein